MAINLRILTIGALTLGIGSWLSRIEKSEWIRSTAPGVAEWFASLNVLWMLLVIVGAVVVAFGIFWARWIWAVILGFLFAVGAYIISFW